MSLRRRRSARVCSLASDKRCLLADPQRAERRPSLATPDFGLGRGDGVPHLGAREVVRVLLEAALPFVVEDGHPPREVAGGLSAQVLYLGLLQFAVGYPRFGDRDVRAGCDRWLLHAAARLYLREVGLDRVAEILERRAGAPILVLPVCVIMYFELASSLQTTPCRADGSKDTR